MNKLDLTEHLKKILAVAFQAKSLNYFQEVLRIRSDLFINPFWHSLVSTCADAMIEYQTDDLDEQFLLRYFEKKKLLAGPLMQFKEFQTMKVDKLSLHRLRLEIDVYIENISKEFFRENLLKTLQSVDKINYDKMKSDLFLGINTIDNNRNAYQLPEGCLNNDLDDILVHVDSSTSLTENRVYSGYQKVDEATGGWKPGDLIFILAYTGEGKSTLLLNNGFHTMCAGQNCVYFVNELQYMQMKIKMVARHTANPDYWDGQLNGVPTMNIERGQLTTKERKIFSKTVADIKNSKTMGKFYIVQLPSDASIGYIEAKLTAIQTSFHIDLVVIDDLRLCRGNLRGDDKAVLSKVIIDTKALAVNFNGGKGIPIMSPWQTKQTSYEIAKESGKYPINSASDTNEVEKQADIMLWLLRTDELKRKNQILAGISKNRMGATSTEPFVLMENMSYSYINDLVGVTVEGTKTVPEIKEEDYDVLLDQVLDM